MLTFALLLLMTCAASSGEWFFLPEPRFMRHEVSFPISAAKDTVLAPAKLGESGIEFPTVAAWHEARLDEDTVRKVTARYASDLLQHVKVEWNRNSKNVVEYATIRSEKFPVCVTVFAPLFAKQFADVFGPKITVVIPNRQTVFVFPGIGVDYGDHAAIILEAWRGPAAKVSLEVFEVDELGLKAKGRIEEP